MLGTRALGLVVYSRRFHFQKLVANYQTLIVKLSGELDILVPVMEIRLLH